MIQLSRAQQYSFRLRRQHLAERAPLENMIQVASDVCGLQAQVLSAAQIGLWTRVTNITLADVNKAIVEDRTLVKTWSVRNTLHLVAAVDLPLFVYALKEIKTKNMESWLTANGLTVDEIQSLMAAIVEALSDGPLTRKQVSARIAPKFGPHVKAWLESGWGGVFHWPVAQGLICFAPSQGKDILFVRVDQWLPELKEVAMEEAQNALLRRYLRVYGPATPQDFSKWIGQSSTKMRAVWTRLEPELIPVEVEGFERGYILREDITAAQAEPLPSPHVCMLPTFDTYLQAHREREHVDTAYHEHIYRIAGWVSSTLLIDGRVAGVWSYERRKNQLEVTIEPFVKLSQAIRTKIKEHAADLGRFFDLPSRVGIEKVTTPRRA